ncbi:pectinesterase inhibitor [Phtheirospermum japonicum]|uniref:Pectinesterase inhibitor n=1 Tax=Phtheirospermum japonicum TaxID=374723 RepID=A0A830CAX5_9LAMI|nr:pectinesterase inhibitor [Phtheirospermum japonicum]GFQ08084.1 pectinesterase inhibitor [Phtheirospermum japonicum]
MELPFALVIRFLLLFSFILISTIAQTPNNLIFEICKKTRNPSLCSQILKSNRKAVKAYSPQELGEIAINLSIISAQAIKKTIFTKRFLKTGDKVLKDRYKHCETNYESAIYYLKSSNYFLKHADISKLARYAAAAVNEPIYCRESFAKRPPAEPAWLKEGNDKLECLCSVILVISNCLSGKKL